jgi:hypothetical protein
MAYTFAEYMTPQEKKRLSLKKDCRNTYGENDKSSRKAIRFRKHWVNRSFRRETNALIESTSTDEIDSTIGSVRRKLWKKSPDTPPWRDDASRGQLVYGAATLGGGAGRPRFC